MQNQIVRCASLLVLFGISASNFANAQVVGADAQAIYNALNVDEAREHGGRLGVDVYHKRVGGLDCTRSQVVYPGAKSQYTCDLGEPKNDREIYESLNVEELVFYGERSLETDRLKTVGGLDCDKRDSNLPHSKTRYDCSLE